MDSGEPPVARQHKWFRRRWVLITMIVMILILLGPPFVVVAVSAREVQGEVRCTNTEVTGVFIEGTRVSRIAGYEINSGFAKWQPGSDPTRATFTHRMILGGDYAIHVGCGSLSGGPVGAWGTNNQTPIISDKKSQWTCEDPRNDTTKTKVAQTCRRD